MAGAQDTMAPVFRVPFGFAFISGTWGRQREPEPRRHGRPAGVTVWRVSQDLGGVRLLESPRAMARSGDHVGPATAPVSRIHTRRNRL